MNGTRGTSTRHEFNLTLACDSDNNELPIYSCAWTNLKFLFNDMPVASDHDNFQASIEKESEELTLCTVTKSYVKHSKIWQTWNGLIKKIAITKLKISSPELWKILLVTSY